MVGRSAGKLKQESGELLDCAFERLAGKQGSEYGIARYAGIECHRESASSCCPSNRFIRRWLPSHFSIFSHRRSGGDLKVGNQGKVVRGQECGGAAVKLEGFQVEGGVIVDVVQVQDWEQAGVSASPVEVSAYVAAAQMCGLHAGGHTFL